MDSKKHHNFKMEKYTEQDYNNDFIDLLKNQEEIYTHIISKNIHNTPLKDHLFYDTLSFRTMICEMIYQAVHMFPNIKEYIIHCHNNKGKSKITIGYLQERDNDGELGLMKVENKHGTFVLDKTEVFHLYTYNRSMESDVTIVNGILLCLYLDGFQPNVIVEIKSFASNKGK